METINTQCTGKHGFDDPKLARKVAHKAKNRGAPKMSVYRCQFCHKWHIGSNMNNKIFGGKSRV